MKRLLIALTITLLLAGCGTTDSEKEYPYQAETFTVQNPENARWDGVQNNSKSTTQSQMDTILVSSPTNIKMEVENDSQLRFGIRIYLENFAIHADSVNPAYTRINVTESDAFPSKARRGHRIGDHYKYRIQLNYDCDITFDDSDVYITYYDFDYVPYRTYNLVTDGLAAVAQDLSGCK